MIKTIAIIAALLFWTQSGAADSTYTDLAEEHCVLLSIDNEVASSVSECPGLAGYRVLLEDFDGRQSLRLIARTGDEHDLRFASTVASGFSQLGAKLEWRYEKTPRGINPYAAIVRLNVQADDTLTRSFLAVIRLRDGPVCVIDRVAPGTRQNERARQIADARRAVPCRKT